MQPPGRRRAMLAAAALAGAILLPALGPGGPGPAPVAAADPTPHPPIAGFACPDEIGGMQVVRAEWFGSDDLGEAYCRYERYTFGERGRWASVQARWSDPDICSRAGPDVITTVQPAATDQPVVLDVGAVTQVEKRAPGRMAWVYYQASELAGAGLIEALADAFLAEAAARSPACPGASPTAATECVLRGLVTDGGWESNRHRVQPGHPI
ncbi:MAG: hypothetical protein MUC54_01800, partial [Chloroflexi bacterium]|nr:hypothetical protein [Chloroflexota bacterium]